MPSVLTAAQRMGSSMLQRAIRAWSIRLHILQKERNKASQLRKKAAETLHTDNKRKQRCSCCCPVVIYLINDYICIVSVRGEGPDEVE